MPHVKMFVFACSLGLALFACGCGGSEATGPADAETPGGEAGPPAEELMDPTKFDDYGKEQAKKANSGS